MFNNEEIAFFLKVGLQPVFFGKILAGQYMPALTYMVGFKDMADRDAAGVSSDPMKTGKKCALNLNMPTR